MDGKGIMEWPGGRKYEGEFKDDFREGYGKIIAGDGKIFEGMWSKGKFLQEGYFINDSNLIGQNVTS